MSVHNKIMGNIILKNINYFIAFILLVFCLFSCSKVEKISPDTIEHFEVADLKFAIAHKYICNGCYKKGEFLALDFSVLDFGVYDFYAHKEDL